MGCPFETFQFRNAAKELEGDRTQGANGVSPIKQEFLREERLPALLKMQSLDLGTEGSDLSR